MAGVQMVTSAQHYLECGNEGCGKNCQFYCNPCHRKLCEECKDEHQRNPMTKPHEVVLFNQRKRQLPVKKCTLHPTRNIDILCKECNVPLCSKCSTMEKHQGHTFNDLEDIFAGKFESNSKKISEIQGYFLATAQDLKKETEEDGKEIKKIMDSIRDSIKDEAESLKSLVDKATSEKLEHANLIEDSLLKQLKPQETTYKEYIAYLETLVGDLRGNFPITDGGGSSVACSLEIKPIPETTKPNLPKYRFGQFSKDNVGKLLGSIVVPSVKEEKRKIKPMEKDSSSQLKPAGAQGEPEQRADAIKRPIVSEVRAFKVPGVDSTWYLSVDKSGRVWASDDGGNLVQTDPEGNQLQKIQTSGKDEGYHTVTPTGDLLYADKIKKIINKIPQSNRISKFFKTGDWEPLSIHSSHINGDVLVGMRKDREAKVTRYKNGKEIQNIQMDNKRQAMYNSPLYITENDNGDICASDDEKQAVVVVSKAGQHRFSYRGQEPAFHPYGICTDCSGNILISVGLLSNGTVEIISQDGHFLSRLFAMDQEIKSPRCVCVSDKNNLYVGQEMSNKVKVFKYEFK